MVIKLRFAVAQRLQFIYYKLAINFPFLIRANSMRYRYRFFSLILLLSLHFFLTACDEQSSVIYVDPVKKAPIEKIDPPEASKAEIRLGIGSIITPKEGFIYYQRLVDYIEEKLSMPVTVIDRGTYQEFNELLADGGLDVAFVCGGPYVEGHEAFNLELLVVPETPSGEIVYYSNLIVAKESLFKSIEDLKGKRFAFTDPQSNSGKLVPTYLLAKENKTPETFFGEIIYTYAHDKSVQAVMDKSVDGASVDSLIYDYLADKDPEVAIKTKIISKSDPYGIPPVVVRPDIPEKLRVQLKEVLLQMDKDPKGLSILQGMKIKRFVESGDPAYDSIRQIREFTRAQVQQTSAK